MSFSSDLMDEVLDGIRDVAKDLDSRDAEDVIEAMRDALSERDLRKVVLPISETYGRKAENADSEEYDEMVERYGMIIAKAIAYQAIKQEKLERQLTRREKDDMLEACDKYDRIVSSFQDNDDRPRRKSRRDEDDRPQRRSRRETREAKSRHSNSFERDGDEKPERKSRREERKEVVVETIVEEGMEDGSSVTSDNYHLLPAIAKDVPVYFAGLEELRFNQDAGVAGVHILDGNHKVNYEKHRTDLYLSGNRISNSIPISIEELDKQLLKAANETVTAFIEKEAEQPDTDTPVQRTSISKSTIITGTYRIDESVLGMEGIVRRACIDVLDNPDIDKCVVGITVIHDIARLSDIDRTSEEYNEFIACSTSLSVEAKLADVKSALLAATKVFSPAQYDIIHRIYNAAVCNALSVSLKLGIKTDSIVRSWSDIEELINTTYLEQPQIVPVIEMNLCASIPTFYEDVETLSIVRNYIFLPISQNEFTISSPVRYGTINKSTRPELFGMIQKLVTTNVPQETFKAYTTIVTNDNYSIPVFKNRSLVTDIGYYACKPI